MAPSRGPTMYCCVCSVRVRSMDCCALSSLERRERYWAPWRSHGSRYGDPQPDARFPPTNNSLSKVPLSPTSLRASRCAMVRQLPILSGPDPFDWPVARRSGCEDDAAAETVRSACLGSFRPSGSAGDAVDGDDDEDDQAGRAALVKLPRFRLDSSAHQEDSGAAARARSRQGGLARVGKASDGGKGTRLFG